MHEKQKKNFLIQLIIVSLIIEQDNASILKDFHKECGLKTTCTGLLTKHALDHAEKCKTDECFAYLALSPPSSTATGTFSFRLMVDNWQYNWGAVGLTTKDKMTKLLVLECVTDRSQDLLAAYISWNEKDTLLPRRMYGREQTGLFRPSVLNPLPPGVDISHIVEEDGYTVCEFVLPKMFSVDFPSSATAGSITTVPIAIDLVKNKYRISLAVGKMDITRPKPVGYFGPLIHQHEGVGIGERINLMQIHRIKPGVNVLQKLHASFMVITYFTLIPTATIIARFFRETWSEQQVFKKRIWFTIHVSLLYGALILIVLAYIFMAASSKGAFNIWPKLDSHQYHAMLGTFSMVLFITQTILHWIIPSKHVNMKRTYSFIHAVVGSTCYFTGLANIALTPYLMAKRVDCSIILMTFVWIGCHFCTYWLLTTHLIISDHAMINNNSRFRALVSYPMRLKTMDDAPGKTTRIVFLAIHIVVSLIVTTITVVILFRVGGDCAKYYPKTKT